MVTLLTRLGDEGVIQFFERPGWKLTDWAFGFLQTQYIRLPVLQEMDDEINTQAYRVYVPGGNSQVHAGAMARL
jgi:hypothetical protein